MHKFDIAASIVAFKNNSTVINAAIKSFLQTPLDVCLLVIDNSPTNKLKDLIIKDHRITYVHNQYNVGFGKAHNQAIRQYSDICKYYLVLNPDVYFSTDTLIQLYNYLESSSSIGLIAPRVLYPNSERQTSCRLIPTPFDLLIRRVPLGKRLFKKRVQINEFLNHEPESIMEAPFLLGCFMLFRMDTLNKAGLFDERYFMYLEDLDICRRINRYAKVVYYGPAFIFHLYERASTKNLNMFASHVVSMIKYFNKWGWFNDMEREVVNQKVIKHSKEREEVPLFEVAV